MDTLIPTLLVGLPLLGAVVLAIRSLLRQRRRGGCSGGCGGCAHACHCRNGAAPTSSAQDFK